jgi:hypothetical protein
VRSYCCELMARDNVMTACPTLAVFIIAIARERVLDGADNPNELCLFYGTLLVKLSTQRIFPTVPSTPNASKYTNCGSCPFVPSGDCC